MRRDPDFFEDTELDLIYMARTLRDALTLEGVLDRAEIDYLVETDTYTAGFLIRRDLTGAFFYVRPNAAQRARGVLAENCYKSYVSD